MMPNILVLNEYNSLTSFEDTRAIESCPLLYIVDFAFKRVSESTVHEYVHIESFLLQMSIHRHGVSYVYNLYQPARPY